MLRRQPGFKDEITFLATDGDEAVAISLWETRANAEAYSRETYPAVLQKLERVVVGTPKVESYEVPISTFHKIGPQSQQSMAR
jgi:heme-degrading monooxygenase HmoA